MNTLLSDLFLKILESSLNGALALLLVGILRLLAGNWIAARYRSFLWFPALLAFLVPVDFLPQNPLALPAQPVVSENVESVRSHWQAETYPVATPIREEGGVTEPIQMSSAAMVKEKEAKKVSWILYLAFAWTAGSLFLAVKWWFDSLGFWQRVFSGQKEVRESTRKKWSLILEEQKLHRHPRLICSNEVEVPVLAGFWHPHVILPADYEKQYTDETLAHVFRHEMAHYRRWDLLFLAFERLVLLLHWFNPLLWLSHRFIRADRELGADASALDSMEAEEAGAYGKALLDVATESGEQDRYAPAVGIFESKKQIAERLRRIASHRRTGWIAAAGTVLLLSLLCFFIFGRSQQADLKPYASLKEDQALLQASINGDLPVVRHYLKAKPDLNRAVDWTGPRTALAGAASENQVKVMKLLLQSGADPNFKPEEKAMTAVGYAIQLGQKEAVELLLKHGAVAEEDKLAAARGDTAYFQKIFAKGASEIPFKQIHTWTGIAVTNNQLELYHLMLETAKKHPGLYSWDYPHEGDLSIAIIRGYKKILQETLDTYPNGLERFKNGPVRIAEVARQTPGMKEWLEERGFKVPPYPFGEQLIDAAGRNDIPKMNKLLDAGADPNYSGEEGWSPVARAANSNRIEAVKLLLSRGGNPNSVKSPGWNYSALTLCDNPKLAEILYKAGADVNGKLYKRDVHIISYPITFGDTAMVEWFISKGVDLKTVKTDEPTLLFEAGNADIARILIQHGIDPKVRDKMGRTALHQIAAYKEKPAPILEVLLENGADPNAADQNGYTPLMAAKDGESVEVLLKYGANPNAKTKNGVGVLESTGYGANVTRLKVLVQHGFKLDSQTAGTLLTLAARSKQADIVAFLLENGADPNAKVPIKGYPGSFYQAMPLAALGADIDTLKLLLDHGGNPETGMSTALGNFKSKVVKLFWERGARNIPESTYRLSQGASLEELKPVLEKEGRQASSENLDKICSHPFVYACTMNRTDVVEFLWAEYKTDKAVIENGLAQAAREGRWQVVEILLGKGVTPNPSMLWMASNNANPYSGDPQKPEDFAKTVELLIKSGALNGASADDRANIMLWAVFTRQPGSNEQVVRQLLAAGLNGNEKGKNTKGKTVLEMVKESCAKGYCSEPTKKIVELLEASVANPKASKEAETVPAQK